MEIYRACLQWRIFEEISKDCRTCILLMSPTVWNEGMELPVPLERFPSLIKTQEFLHPLLAKVFAEDRGARARERERARMERGRVFAWPHSCGAVPLRRSRSRRCSARSCRSRPRRHQGCLRRSRSNASLRRSCPAWPLHRSASTPLHRSAVPWPHQRLVASARSLVFRKG